MARYYTLVEFSLCGCQDVGVKTSLQDFLNSLGASNPPDGTPLLEAVWYGLTGSWHRAHEYIQNQSGTDAAWIHAWLHRMEGDMANARYWYREARREAYAGDLKTEGEAIAAELLSRRPTPQAG